VTTHEGEGRPRELSGKQSFLVGCGIAVVVLLLVGLVVVWRGKRIDAEKRRATLDTLAGIRLAVIPTTSRERFEWRGMPSADGSGADWTGQRALGLAEVAVDGWGNPIRYRCPGPVHKKGWDLWSCGPNGKDDEGTFDDILVGGDDIAPETSR
jgi:hypothetical protein